MRTTNSGRSVMTFIRALVCVTTATVVVVLTPSGARADEYHRYDRWKDIVSSSTADEPGPNFDVPAPDRTIGDITQLRIDHRSTVVHLAAYFRALPRAGEYNRFQIEFQTGSVNRVLEIVATPGHWRGRHRLLGEPGDPPCANLRWSIQYDHKRIVVDIPRTCLRSPTSVRVAFGTEFFAKGRVYCDDALASRADYEPITFSPKISR